MKKIIQAFSFFIFFFILLTPFIVRSYASLDLNDKTTNGNNLTNYGAVESSSVPSGLIGATKSVEIGSGDYLIASDSSSLDITGNLTIEGWIYIADTNGGQTLVSKNDVGQLSYQAYVQGDDSILMNLSSSGASNPGNGYAYSQSNIIPANTWTHIAFVYSPSTITIYVNGSVVSTIQSSVPSSIHAGTADLRISNGSNGILRISDLRIWNTARTATQVSGSYTHQLIGSEPGLAAYWPFGPLSTTLPYLTDVSGNGNHLTNHGGAESSSVPSGLTGAIKSVELGPGDYLDAPDSPSLDITGALTIEGWVYITDTNGGQDLISKDSPGELSYQAYIQGDDSILMNLSSTGASNPGNGYGYSQSSVIPANTWTHIAFVYSPSTVTLYINGSVISTTQSSVPSSIHAGTAILRIPNDSNGVFRIDDLRIWNTARSSNQIADNYTHRLTGLESNLAAYWPFENLLQSKITYYTINDGTDFTRSTTPVSSGVSTQTNNSDGSVAVSINSASGYADSGFVLYEGTLGDLPNFTVNGSGDQYSLNLWLDTGNNNDFFAWSSNVLTSLDGDTYALGPTSSSGVDAVTGSSQFYVMSDGQNHSLSDLKSGAVSGISSTTKVTVWVGVNTSSGSTSATIHSISGL